MLGSLFYSPLLLIVMAIVLRALPLSQSRNQAWQKPWDYLLIALVACAATALNALFLYSPALDGEVSTCDYVDICTSTTYIRQLSVEGRSFLVTRQPGAGLLPSLLARPLGIINGVALGALLSGLLTVAAIATWARLMAGRAAAVVAAFASCTIAALVIQPRHLSFYPETAAGYAWSAVGLIALIQSQTPLRFALAGLGIGAALLMDHSGLLYALPPLGMAFLLCFKASMKRWPIHLFSLLLPIVLSWSVAHIVIPPQSPSFEDKMMTYLHDSKGFQLEDPNMAVDSAIQNGKTVPIALRLKAWALPERLFLPVSQMPERPGYNWGHSHPIQIIRSIFAIAILSTEAGSTPPNQEIWDYTQQIERHVKPWIPVSIISLLLTLFALRRRPLMILALLGVLVPYIMSFRVLLGTQVWPKLMMAPVIPIPVLMGCAFTTLAFKAGVDHAKNTNFNAWKAPALSAILSMIVVTGIAPTWLSPKAPWRISFKLCDDIYGPFINAERRLKKQSHDPMESEEAQFCEELFMNDIRNGFHSGTWIYPDPDRIKQANRNHHP